MSTKNEPTLVNDVIYLRGSPANKFFTHQLNRVEDPDQRRRLRELQEACRIARAAARWIARTTNDLDLAVFMRNIIAQTEVYEQTITDFLGDAPVDNSVQQR